MLCKGLFAVVALLGVCNTGFFFSHSRCTVGTVLGVEVSPLCVSWFSLCVATSLGCVSPPVVVGLGHYNKDCATGNSFLSCSWRLHLPLLRRHLTYSEPTGQGYMTSVVIQEHWGYRDKLDQPGNNLRDYYHWHVEFSKYPWVQTGRKYLETTHIWYWLL